MKVDSGKFMPLKKGGNWALRSIGKRNAKLNAEALALSERLAATDDRTARWIGKDAIRDLTGPKTLARLEKQAAKKR